MGNCFKKNKIVPLELITNNECRDPRDSNERDNTIRPKLLRKKTPSKIIKTSTLYNFENQ